MELLHEFTIMIEPMTVQTAGKRMRWNPSTGTPIFFKNAKCKKWQKQVCSLASRFAPDEPYDFPLSVDFFFIISRPGRLVGKKYSDGLIYAPTRPDRDNFIKGAQDSIKGFWLDDSQIVDGRTAKFYAERSGSPRIHIRISKIIKNLS